MAAKVPNRQYNVAAADSLAVRIAGYQRRRMYHEFLTKTGVRPEDSILDVGATSDQSYASSNYLEAWYPYKNKITAVGVDDAKFLEKLYPGMTFISANALSLPFKERSFDIVHASAVIEHVGSFENQIQLIRDCCRVARRGLFMTTPNRWFPIEFHTVLPLVHWLPKNLFRALMQRTGRDFFAQETNLNLMTKREVLAAATAVERFDVNIYTISLACWPSNILLHMQRRPS